MHETFSATAAEVGRIAQSRIDDQFTAAVIVSNVEADFVVRQLAKTSRDSFFGISSVICGGLIDMRRVEVDVSIGGGEDEIAGIACINMGGRAVEAQCNLAAVGAGRDAEIVFQLSFMTVVDEINAGIDARVFHASKLGNVAAPFRGVVADEITALARKRLRGGNLRSGIGSVKPHANYAAGGWLPLGGGSPQTQHGFVGGQKQAIARAVGEVLDLSSGLSLVRFEDQRQ